MTNSLPPERPPRLDRDVLPYLFVWLLAFATRAVYLWQIGHTPAFTLLLGDAATYDAWARQIANGDWLGHDVFYQAPLYPYFLGTLHLLFKEHLLAIRLLQIIIGATSCLLLACAGRSFFTRTTGLLAGVLLALYPTAIFFDASIQKSVLDLFFVCALLATLGGLRESPRPRRWLGAGVVLALLALTRENALIFLPIVLGWLFAAWPGELSTTRLRWAGLLLLGLAVILLPVGLRNLLIGHEFHLTTAQFGPNFYIGNGRDATGTYQSLRWGHGSAKFERTDATRLAEQAAGRTLTPSEVSRYWTTKALHEIRADDSRWLRLLWKKWRLVWNVSEIGDSDDQYTQGDWSSLLGMLNRLFHFGILCPLAALGFCLTWNQRQRLWVLYAMVLGYAASVALFYVFSRYRFPLVPMLLLFAAAGLTCLPDALRKMRWGTLGVGVAATVLVASICNRPMVPEVLTRATTHYNIATKLMALRMNPEEAASQYKEAIRLVPEFEAAHVGLGKLLESSGRTDDAIGEYSEALRIKPDYAEAHDNLAVTLARLGRFPEAIAHWEQALQSYPDFAEAHYNLGLALARMGKLPEAMDHWEQALRINPDYAEAHFNLGVALEHTGNVPGAIGHYQQALRIKPDLTDAQNALARLQAHQ
jgi:tetratricopeptide (TPR) repeat protein